MLKTVQGRQCYIVFPKTVQNCSTWPKLARKNFARHDPSWPGKTVQNVSKWGNECLKGRCACIYKCDSCHYLALLLPVKVSVNCAEVIPAATFITLNRQFQLNWQGSLVIRLTAIVSIDGLSCTIIIALIEKTVRARSFFCFITASWWYHNQTWTSGMFCVFLRFESYRLSDLNLTDLHHKLRTVKSGHFGMIPAGNHQTAMTSWWTPKTRRRLARERKRRFSSSSEYGSRKK